MGVAAIASGASADRGSWRRSAMGCRRASKQIGEFNALVAEDEAKATREAYQFEQIRAVKAGKRAASTMLQEWELRAVA